MNRTPYSMMMDLSLTKTPPRMFSLTDKDSVNIVTSLDLHFKIIPVVSGIKLSQFIEVKESIETKEVKALPWEDEVFQKTNSQLPGGQRQYYAASGAVGVVMANLHRWIQDWLPDACEDGDLVRDIRCVDEILKAKI